MSTTVSHEFPNAVLREIATWMLDEGILSNLSETYWTMMRDEWKRRDAHLFLKHVKHLSRDTLTINFDSDRDAVEFMLRFVG
jgi:hypothetical protein